jgi:hypothetical protein
MKIYRDFSWPILDYFSTLNGGEFVYEILIPIISGISGSLLFHGKLTLGDITTVLSLLINVYAILVGFSIAVIAIFTTINPSKIEVLRIESNRKILGKKITWFRFVYLNMVLSGISNMIMLLVTLGALPVLKLIHEHFAVIFGIMLTGTLFNILLAIRNITNLYLIFFRLPADEA